MIRKLLLSLALSIFVATGLAQTTTITAANTKGSDNNKIGAGTITFRATDLLGNPFFGHQGGLVIPKAVVCLLVNGAITGSQAGGSCSLVDTAATAPAHFCYVATIYDSVGRWTAPPTPCMQPTGSTWSLDSFVPITPTAIVNTGVAGPPGPAGPGGVDGIPEVDALAGTDLGAKLSACFASLSSTYGGSCDARGFTFGQTIGAALTISLSNVAVYLPCTTITTSQPLTIAPGTRNVTIHGCAYQGGSNVSGTAGGTVWVYTGSAAAIKVGDSTYAQDTKGFHLDNINFNTASAGAGATVLSFYRVQEIDLRNVYLNGNQSTGQTGIYLDGTGNYTGGTFDSDTLNGFGTGVYMTGHLSGSVVGDYSNASTFTRLHIVCPTSGNNPIAGTYGVNIAAADGNTWSGGDIENCSTMFHLGANAVNNTIVGLRNENSTIQYQADSGSGYNSVVTGGTLFTGALVDNGSRNSFWDAFHRTANGIKGDWYASQIDATVINHLRLGIGTGTVRGLQWESAVDQGTSSNVNNWLWGLTDGAGGATGWIYQDLINNTIRLLLGQNNAAGGNNQTALNAAGTGNVCFQCSANSGTGGVAFSSGGATPTTVGTVDGSGNTQFNGTLQVGGVTTHVGSVTVKNQAAAEIDVTLQAGSTGEQKEALVYRNYAGAGQWYALKDTSNNWSLNSAIDNIDHFKAYQSGDTYVDAAGSGAVRVNYESNSGTGGLVVYSGGSSPSAWFTVSGSGSFKFGGLASASGYGDMRLDSSGWATNSGAYTSSGTASGSSTTATHSFSTAYTSTPQCTASPTTNAGSFYISAQSTSAITITYSTSGSQTFNVICRGAGGIY